ncbi:MAG: glycosyltransferase [Acidobacteriota bacterium]
MALGIVQREGPPSVTEPVRVVRLITRLNIGGPSIQAIGLADRLAAEGFRTVLVHGRLGPGEGDMSYLMPPTVTAVYEPTLQRSVAPISDLRAVLRVYRLLCRMQPAIVHTHMAKAGAVGRVATMLYNQTRGRGRPCRVVHTYHGHVLEGYFGPRKAALFLNAERWLARLTDRLVAISPQILHDLLNGYRIGRQDQYRVVPLGFDLRAFEAVDDEARRQARETLHIPAGTPVIVTVGRLTAIKQHELFLDAARLIVDKLPDAVLLIAGDGERRDELEARAAALGLGAQVRFLGWRRDLAVLYGAADVFALTSRNEGTPVALIEAMAAAVPGVSTDVGGVRDVIADASVGRRVPDQAPAAFAGAVIDVVRSPDRGEMGRRARQLVVSRYGIERLVRDIVALYRGLE